MEKQFVSRGGLKLQAALDTFKIDVKDLIVLDVGSSTGGFVDCLLQNGAAKVYSVDTSYGELAWKLRKDERVAVLERTNILHLEYLPSSVILSGAKRSEESPTNVGPKVSETSSGIPHSVRNDKKGVQDDLIKASMTGDNNKVDLITIDASWTKLELILPVVKNFLRRHPREDGDPKISQIIALLKPHYEAEPLTRKARYQAEKKDLVKGVLPKEIAEKVKDEVIERVEDLGFRVEKQMESPILGGGGNTEYLLLLSF